MKKFWTSPFTWIDGVSALPALLAVAGVDYKIQRICRLLRVLRLLRLLEREPDSVLFGVMQSDNMSVQLIGVAAGAWAQQWGLVSRHSPACTSLPAPPLSRP